MGRGKFWLLIKSDKSLLEQKKIDALISLYKKGLIDDALKEAKIDEDEGADIIMVKPASPYLDVISQVKNIVQCPVAAYQVSGEYTMIKVASEKGWLDEDKCIIESLTGIKRAGANFIITYFASSAAQLIKKI